MGIKKLYDVIKKMSPDSITIKNIKDYENKIILIDAVLMIYKNIMAIRKNGYDIKNNGKNITHIHSMINKLKKFKEFNITAIFVFDGKPPDLKTKTLEERERIKSVMKAKYDKAKTNKEKEKYYYLKSDITDEEISDCVKLIQLFGFCTLFAREEADQLLASLSRNDKVSGVVTDDMDILIFGGKNILKNFSVDPKKYFYEINLDKFKQDAKFNQDKLIILALLLGTDYSMNVKNIGPSKAPELVKKYKTIDELYKNKIINKEIKSNFIKSFNIFKKTYLEGTKDFEKLCVHKINLIELKKYLHKFNYKETKIEEITEFMKK